jgi:A/G-specific adenine glycosylase
MNIMDKRKFLGIICQWGNANRRKFSWRSSENAYDILIAEILLQRTKANQVLPVYNIFLRRFPNIYILNKTDEKEIVDVISNLGLKKRAKGLKLLSKKIVEEFDGEIPKDKKTLLKMPFIGNYTADAILCHAFNIRTPTYDTNFARVIDRYFHLSLSKPISKDPKGYSFAKCIIRHSYNEYKQFNLSIIDFADAICLPKKPKCVFCPLNSSCYYYLQCKNK